MKVLIVGAGMVLGLLLAALEEVPDLLGGPPNLPTDLCAWAPRRLEPPPALALPVMVLPGPVPSSPCAPRLTTEIRSGRKRLFGRKCTWKSHAPIGDLMPQGDTQPAARRG